MFSKLKFLFLLLFFVKISFAQNQRIDSLKHLAIETKDDSLKAYYYEHIAFQQSKDFPHEGLEFAQKALDFAEKSKSTKRIAGAQAALASNYRSLSSYSKAIDFNLKALKNYRSLGDSASVAAIFNNLSIVENKLGNSLKALEYNYSALTIYDEIQQDRNKAIVKENIANIYFNIKDYHQSKKYYKEALSTYHSLGNKADLARCYGNIARLFHVWEEYDSSKIYLNKSIALNKVEDKEVGLLINYSNLGNVFLETNKIDSALHYYFLANKAAHRLNLTNFIATTSGNIGTAYLTEYKNHTKAEQLRNAEKYLKRAVSLCDSIGFVAPKIEFSKELLELYELKNEYQKAFILLKETKAEEDSLNNLENKKAIALLEHQREQEIRENEIALKDKEIEIKQLNNQKRLLGLILVISILSVLILIGTVIYIYRIKKYKSQMSEIKQLQSHEFRGPIASMKGISKLMRQRVQEGKKIDDLITAVYDLSEKMDNIVKRIINKSNHN